MTRIAVLLVLLTAADARAQLPADEWRVHHRDYASTRYSPLDQITAANVSRLTTVWEWRPDTIGGTDYKNESTPLMIGGVLYFTSGPARAVIAADAATGQTKWIYRIDEGARLRVAPRRNSGRGVSYWTNGRNARIFVVTPGFQLVALNAADGQPVASFGKNGIVDLKLELGVPLNVDSAAIGSSSPPLIFENTVVIGPALEVGLRPPSRRNVPGRILALDARTGKLLWRFNTIPAPGEFGHDTWLENSWQYTGNAGAWAPLSLDEKLGYLYLPTEAATGDYYGGHRPGDNLFSTTLLCLDARTGKRMWHYQILHHDIWDYDNPTAPILADITVDGRRIEAVVQLTKQSFAYVFDRVTGKPVWPIVEKPVPPSDVPGERAAPTQPFPSKPAAFDRQGVSIDDLIDFNPELRAEAIAAVKRYRLGALFAPASLLNAPDSTRGTLSLPGTLGGANWEHGAFDPETGMLYVGSTTSPAVLALSKDTARSDMDYIMSGGSVPRVRGLPIIKPPYSRITAINLNTGDHAWMVPNGATLESVASSPALQGLTIPPTGGTTRPVMLATKSLLFAGEGYGGRPVIRALDKKNGATVWETTLPAPVTSQPMTYRLNGKQYIAFWVGDVRARVPGRLVALALPE